MLLIEELKNMKAPINKIISFSNVDGPGNRMTIFFQSCPFHCLYCHNPETIHYCISCGTCVKSCPVQALTIDHGQVVWHQETCIDCDTCIKVCQHMASPKITWMSVEDVIERIKIAKPFITGITVSGGECMNHPEFLTELFKKVHTLGLTTFMDSNGYHDMEKYPELMAHTDKVMLDVKAFDPQFHLELTGQSNTTVLKNLDYLLKHDQCYEVRTVLLNHPEQNKKTVLNVSKIIQDKCFYKLIKYRPFGVRKEGLEKCGHHPIDDEELQKMAYLALKNGAIHIKTT